MARTPAKLAIVLTLIAATGGCAETHVVGQHRTVYIALSEYRLRPQNVRAPAGRLTIFVRNYGRLTHDLAVVRQGKGQAATAATPPISPGDSAELELQLGRGRYVMTSNLFSDQALGLYGNLTVH